MPRTLVALASAAMVLAAVAAIVSARRAQSFRRVPDGARFAFTLGELSTSGRGASVDVAFGDAPAPAGARERLRAVAPAGLRTTLTRWAPADARPADYPRALPFLAGREAHTVEQLPERLTDPAGYAAAAGRGARWVTATVPARDSTFALLAAGSEADGWRPESSGAVPAGAADPAQREVRYTRPGWTRALSATRLDRMMDVPGRASPTDWWAVEVADRPVPAAGSAVVGAAPPWASLTWPLEWNATPDVSVGPPDTRREER
jgi:hypothetical protein